MNLKTLKDNLLRIKEIKPIGRTIEMEERIIHAMGFTCDADNKLSFMILEYDAQYRERMEQYELSALKHHTLTNRCELSSNIKNDFFQLSHHIEKIQIESLEFRVKESSSSICNQEQWENMQLFTSFLIKGWNPFGIDTQNMDNIYLTTLVLDGIFTSIPKFDSSSPIHCSIGKMFQGYLEEQKITLTIGNTNIENIHLINKATDKIYEVYINRVYLYDIWSEMEALFANSRMKELFSEEELAQKKEETEVIYTEECPKGFYYIVIEYECEEEVSLQFYSKDFLDAEPIRRNQATTFLMKPEEPTGKMGMKLRAACIQEPFPKETKTINAEIFSYFENKSLEDIII